MTEHRQARTDEEFKAFVQARWPQLVRYAYLLVGDQQHAEDVVQVALERTWGRWGRVGVDSPERYVRTAIARQAVSRHRWLRRRVAERPFGERPPEPPTGAGDADGYALRDLVWRELLDLPPRMRAVVVLRVWEDLPEKEVADVLDCSVGAVKSQLSRGLARLRKRSALRDAAGLPLPGAAPGTSPSWRSIDDPAR